MYFLYLKLCLELEEKKIPINGQLIKVNKKLFKDHSLDTILTSSFDEYFKLNKRLFTESPVRLLTESENLDQDHLYFKVPKNRTEKVMIREIKSLMKNKLKVKDNDLFSTNKVPYLRLHVEYNCSIMSINKYSRNDIQGFVNEKYQNVSKFLIQVRGQDISNEGLVLCYPQSVSRVVSRCRRRLINFSENRIFP